MTDARVQAAARAWARYRRLMRWMALVAATAVVLALAYLKSRGGPLPLPMVLATILGVGLSVMLGTALMGLVFLSSISGHDDDAGEDRGRPGDE